MKKNKTKLNCTGDTVLNGFHSQKLVPTKITRMKKLFSLDQIFRSDLRDKINQLFYCLSKDEGSSLSKSTVRQDGSGDLYSPATTC